MGVRDALVDERRELVGADIGRLRVQSRALHRLLAQLRIRARLREHTLTNRGLGETLHGGALELLHDPVGPAHHRLLVAVGFDQTTSDVQADLLLREELFGPLPRSGDVVDRHLLLHRLGGVGVGAADLARQLLIEAARLQPRQDILLVLRRRAVMPLLGEVGLVEGTEAELRHEDDFGLDVGDGLGGPGDELHLGGVCLHVLHDVAPLTAEVAADGGHIILLPDPVGQEVRTRLLRLLENRVLHGLLDVLIREEDDRALGGAGLEALVRALAELVRLLGEHALTLLLLLVGLELVGGALLLLELGLPLHPDLDHHDADARLSENLGVGLASQLFLGDCEELLVGGLDLRRRGHQLEGGSSDVSGGHFVNLFVFWLYRPYGRQKTANISHFLPLTFSVTIKF